MQLFSIGQLSKQAEVKVCTIRYYEKIGLLDSPPRSEGNQRRYLQKDMQRLSFIRHARDLGFSLENIRELVTLSHEHECSCDEVHRITKLHLKSVKQRIAKLKRLEFELKRIGALADTGRTDDCKIIQALAEHSLCETSH